MDLLKNIVQCRDIRLYDCFMFAVLSHGEQNEVEFVDGGKIDVEEILTKFNNYNCRSLVGKPKIFILPFCRFVSRITLSFTGELIWIVIAHILGDL